MRPLLALAACLLVTPADADDWGPEVAVTQDPILQFATFLAVDGDDVAYALWADYSDGDETQVNLQTSTDRGATWSIPAVIFGSRVFEGFDLFADDSGLHVLLIEFSEDDDGEYKKLYYARSVDGGANWTAPVRLGDDESIFQGQLFSDGGTLYVFAQNEDLEAWLHSSLDGVEWSEQVVDLGTTISNPDLISVGGVIHMAFGGFLVQPEIRHSSSSDGGANWTTPTQISVGAGVHSQLPSMVMDGSGELHVVWEDDRSGQFEVRYASSTNGGASWSSDAQLNDTPYGARAKILRDGAALNVVWTQYHGDMGWPASWSSGDFGILWHKTSDDGGASWSGELRVSDNAHIPTMELPDRGADRVRLASFEQGFCALYQDRRDGNFDVYYRAYGEQGSAMAYCFGGACPCDNTDPGAGCANSSGAGALLGASGTYSVGTDDLAMTATNLIPGQPAILFSAAQALNNGSGTFFGDGLRCAGDSAFRFGTRTPDGSGVANWGPGLIGMEGGAPGETRRYQGWYRDPQGGPCGNDFNLTQALEVVYAP